MHGDEDSEREYRIVVRGELSDRWSAWFNDMAISSARGEADGAITVLAGPVADQAALRGILCRLWDLGLTVVSVHQARSSEAPEDASGLGGT